MGYARSPEQIHFTIPLSGVSEDEHEQKYGGEREQVIQDMIAAGSFLLSSD